MKEVVEKLNDWVKLTGNKNWIDDFKLENGNYYNNCVFCKELFVGHKRRVVCKECYLNNETKG